MLIALSEKDREILNSYKNVVDGLAATYGSHTEFVLHSLDIDNPSVIMIANGHITGREVGAPITDLALNSLRAGQDVSDPYFCRNSNGNLLRSVTSVIKNSAGKPIGVLCTNMNLDVSVNQFFGDLLAKEVPQNSPETFFNNQRDMIEESINDIRDSVAKDKSISANRKNRSIVEGLEKKGIFNLNDSVNITAELLSISVHSVYRYLRESKSKA